jgi:hypothetical protein
MALKGPGRARTLGEGEPAASALGLLAGVA